MARNILQQMLAEDGVQIMEEFGYDCSWNGLSLRCTMIEPDVEADLEDGGFIQQGDFKIKVLRSAFTSGVPKVGDRFVIDGRKYAVLSTHNKPESAFIIFFVAA